MTTRRQILALAAAIPAGLALRAAQARESPTFVEKGAAIGGADPVAYFTEARPVAGSPDHAVAWSGATWRFASAKNAARFEADPERYAPAYGGYCAWAVSEGYLAPIVPEAWTVHDGRLYLNASLRVRRRWLRDIPGHIARAEAHWPAVLG